MCIKKQDNANNCNNKKIVEELFEFYEEELYRNTNENREYLNKISNIEPPFYESLNDNQKQQFEEIMELKGLNEGETDKRFFVFGFNLAMRLMIESKN